MPRVLGQPYDPLVDHPDGQQGCLSVCHMSAVDFGRGTQGGATKEQAAELVTNVLPLLEMPGGIAASTEKSRGPISES